MSATLVWAFNFIVGQAFSVLFLPFRSFQPWPAMVFISLLTGLFMLLIFRQTSNQAGIREVKDQIKAHLLEIRLYKDNLGVTTQAYRKILKYNLKYLAFSAKPMLVLLLPLVIILSQLNLWFGYLSLRPGEQVMVKIFLDREATPKAREIAIEASDGIAVETPPLRLGGGKEVNWRVRALRKGTHELKIRIEGESGISTTVAVATPPLTLLCPRQSRRLLDNLLYPGKKPISSSGSVKTIEITYPDRTFSFLGLKFHWLIPYFVLSILFGLALKKPLGVEI